MTDAEKLAGIRERVAEMFERNDDDESIFGEWHEMKFLLEHIDFVEAERSVISRSLSGMKVLHSQAYRVAEAAGAAIDGMVWNGNEYVPTHDRICRLQEALKEYNENGMRHVAAAGGTS